MRCLVRLWAYAWALPCSLAGLLMAGLVLLLGGRARLESGVLEVALPAYSRALRSRYAAITFGHVVLGRSEEVLDRLRAHEHAHVRQYERWGVFFLVAYPLSSLAQWLRGKRPYRDNWFEVDARTRSGEEKR